MDRFNELSKEQQQILTCMYEYLGFNEITTFSNFIDFMFYNVRSGLSFEAMVNRTLAHIITNFRSTHPEYYDYTKYIWLSQENMMKHMEVGSSIEYDPKGVVRLYVKENYSMLASTKF